MNQNNRSTDYLYDDEIIAESFLLIAEFQIYKIIATKGIWLPGDHTVLCPAFMPDIHDTSLTSFMMLQYAQSIKSSDQNNVAEKYSIKDTVTLITLYVRERPL